MDTHILPQSTSKRLASVELAAGQSPAMVRTMCELGRYVDDCGVLAAAAPLPTLDEMRRAVPAPVLASPPPSGQPLAARPSAALSAFPLVSDGLRATPNALLRGALFAAIQGKDRRALKREVLASLEGVEIRFTGWQLDQSDLDVWETIVHLAQHHILGEPVFFSAHEILTAMGRGTGKAQHEWLKESFARLAGGVCEIKVGRHAFFGALLTGERDDETGRYRIDPQPKLLSLYRAGWTAIDWHERQKLKRKPLALWLWGWFCSHASPYPLKVETIRRLCGSRTESLRKFRQNLVQALDDLKAIGAIESWTINADDVVDVVRATRTASQERHLDRKAVGRKPKGGRRGGMAPVGDLLKPK